MFRVLLVVVHDNDETFDARACSMKSTAMPYAQTVSQMHDFVHLVTLAYQGMLMVPTLEYTLGYALTKRPTILSKLMGSVIRDTVFCSEIVAVISHL